MADGRAKTLLDNKVILLGVIAAVGALVLINFSGSAFAVTASDPEAVYNCYKVDDKGQFLHQNDTDGKPTDQLVP